MGWSHAMAPVIMGNPDRPELGEELTNSFCRTDPEIAKRFARTTFLADNRADLAGVTARCLVLQCAEDVIAPPAVGEYVHRHLPNSELVLMKATGHCPNLSAPEETISAINAFLARDGGRPRTWVQPSDDFEDLFENAPCGYLSADAAGRITRATRLRDLDRLYERAARRAQVS